MVSVFGLAVAEHIKERKKKKQYLSRPTNKQDKDQKAGFR